MSNADEKSSRAVAPTWFCQHYKQDRYESRPGSLCRVVNSQYRREQTTLVGIICEPEVDNMLEYLWTRTNIGYWTVQINIWCF